MPDLYNLIKCKIEFIISIRGNMKSNKYLTNKKSIFISLIIVFLMILLIYGIIALKIFFEATTSVPVSFIIMIYSLVSIVSIIVGLVPILYFDTGTMYCEDEFFIYKRNIFSSKYFIEYRNLQLVYITFKRTPSRFHSPMGKAVFIYYRKKNYIRIELNQKIIQELIKHIDSKKIEVEFNSFLSFRKKYRKLLYPYLDEESQLKVQQRYPLEVVEFVKTK